MWGHAFLSQLLPRSALHTLASSGFTTVQGEAKAYSKAKWKWSSDSDPVSLL